MDAHPAGPDLHLTDLLSLGENFVSQSDLIHLRDLFCKTVSERFNCSARLWFCEPFYPLPGEPEVETVPNSPAPTVVMQCFESKQPIITSENPSPSGIERQIAAFPVITQGNLLAILSLSRSEGELFSLLEIDQINQICAVAALALQVNRQSVLKNWRYEQISLVRSVSSQSPMYSILTNCVFG
jgi:GAF domain-containing protein